MRRFARLQLTGFEGEIASFALWMKKQGYREATIRSAGEVLRSIARHADLLNADVVKLLKNSAALTWSLGFSRAVPQHLQKAALSAFHVEQTGQTGI